jgi:hypothetical protein
MGRDLIFEKLLGMTTTTGNFPRLFGILPILSPSSFQNETRNPTALTIETANFFHPSVASWVTLKVGDTHQDVIILIPRDPSLDHPVDDQRRDCRSYPEKPLQHAQ